MSEQMLPETTPAPIPTERFVVATSVIGNSFADTTVSAKTERTVATTKTSGVVILRYAPKQPKSSRPDTTS